MKISPLIIHDGEDDHVWTYFMDIIRHTKNFPHHSVIDNQSSNWLKRVIISLVEGNIVDRPIKDYVI